MQRLFFLFLVACGGQIAGTSEGGIDGSTEDGFVDAGFTECTAPGGSSLCGGSCGVCVDGGCVIHTWHPAIPSGDDDVLRICNFPHGGSGCVYAPDGFLCAVEDSAPQANPNLPYLMDDLSWFPPEVGYLYHLNGRDDLVRYADRAAYDGSDLPTTPITCPSIPNVPLCGGACGDCPSPTYPTTKYECIGRSPLHPYSMCMNHATKVYGPTCVRDPGHPGPCPADQGSFSCFTFKVDEASQAISDTNSLRIDSVACAAAETAYPGGGYCTCPQ